MEKLNYWDDIYRGKIKSNNFLQLSEGQVSKILKHFPYAKSALDIGCGRGEMVAELIKRGLTVTGIDISPVAVKEAEKIPGVAIYCADFETFYFSHETKFDLIFVKFVLAYIENKQKFFKHISELLTKDGGLVIVSPVTKNNENNEIFVQQNVLDDLIPRYFTTMEEDKFYEEEGKKLSLYILKKAS